MTSRFDLYGWKRLSLQEAAEQVGLLLGITMDLHDSYYQGGDYYLWRREALGELMVQANFRDEDGVLAEPSYERYPVLLRASCLRPEWFDLLPSLAGVSLLRSKLL